ncbi:MAG: zinc ribbon domain-containing protein, partial [Erysipelotrichales bacterium]|nr:zinc ribbon domain-containing protein [Erysipelotrichales bacterium]
MYCLKCGKQISDDAKFCLFCGAKVVKTNAAQFREIKEVPEKPSRKEIKKQKKELKKAAKAQKKKKKSGFGRFFRRLVLISIAGCLVAAFVYPGYFRDVFDPRSACRAQQVLPPLREALAQGDRRGERSVRRGHGRLH